MLKGLSQFNLPELEEKVLAFWRENEIIAKTLSPLKGYPTSPKELRGARKQFVFYEGPPTANSRPGTHHVIGRVLKDLIPRFKTMQGYFVARRAGWDTHGLPVEIEVEKELGIKSKLEIEKFGIAEFNQRAKASVWKYKEEWEKLTERIGFWLDTKHPYSTCENEYIEKLWGVLKKIDERKLLYKGYKVVPWCSRCGTALSSHELAQGYKEVTDTAVYIRFTIHDSRFKNTSFLVWTTTPWTLPGNVALAINPKHTFVKVIDPHKQNCWLIVEERNAERLGLLSELKVQKFKAKDLIGLSYDPLFQVQPLQSEKSYTVYAADFVNADEGTGVVHTAVMYGEDDYQLGVKIGLPQHHTVDEQGRFTNDVSELAGLYGKGKATEEKIIKHLQSKQYLYTREMHTHDYPFCWRCNTPLLYYATDSWFIAMSAMRKELTAANKKVSWMPAHIKEGRFGEWVREAKDWALSRARYWGTPLPIWRCGTCDYYAVVGSVAELKKLGGNAPDDLHRPFIDAVLFPCPKCKGGIMARVKEVADVWFDSGAMPFAAGEYPERYPADYICEAIDQTRGWFYTLMAVGVALGHGAPYKNVVCYSHLLDAQGKKMSKSKGNAVDPWDLVQKYGADAMRWHFYASTIVKEPQRFHEQDIATTARPCITLLYNAYVFLETYDRRISDIPLRTSDVHILDTWIMARLHQTIQETTEYLEKYAISDAAHAIESLINDLSRWYIRRSRKRAEALPVLRHILLEISKLIAPFMPFFAEALYQSLGHRKTNGLAMTPLLESVHLENWPKANQKLINKTLINGMVEVRRLASLALAKRADAKINVRRPLQKIKLRLSSSRQMIAEETRTNKELRQILADEVNVKEVIFDSALQEEVVLDMVITPALREEGLYRELTRMVQGLRQKAGCNPGDRVMVYIDGGIEIQKIIEERMADFMREVNARSVSFQKKDDVVVHGTVDLDSVVLWAGIIAGGN